MLTSDELRGASRTMTFFSHHIASAEAIYRIESRLADAEHRRLLRRLRRARKAAAALGPGP
jgi:hypothetical protein